MTKKLEFTKVFYQSKILSIKKKGRTGMIHFTEMTSADFKNSLLSELLKLDLFNTHAEHEKQRMNQSQHIFYPRGIDNESSKKGMV